MICFPNAKINIGLNILEKRIDGFHNLESVFYPVPWTDILEIIPSDKFHFTLTGIHVDGQSEDNLCVKVFKSLQQRFKLPEVHIHLHKNIPVGAGLGGGSSDAAFAVKLLNELFDLRLTIEEMQEFIRPFGSDCAFFIANKPVFAFERGDHFDNLSLDLNGKYIVMIYPGLHISTKEAYEGVSPQIPPIRIKEAAKGAMHEWKDTFINDFEKGIFVKYPQLAMLKKQLYSMGAWYACMSGSGSTVFGLFDTEIDTENLFPDNYRMWKGYLS